MKKLIILLIILSIILGSNNYQELNSISIITNIGIEEKSHKYKVIFQEIIPNKENNKINNTLKYYYSSGSNLEECIKKIKENIPKNIYYNHLENIVINSKNYKILNKLDKIFPNDLDNFNIVYTNDNIIKVLKYENNYNYINSIVIDKLKYRNVKINNLDNKKIKVPYIKFKNKILTFYKYEKVGGK